MKATSIVKSLILSLLLVVTTAHAQTSDRDKAINRSRRELTAKSAGTYLTEFNDMRLNFVNLRVQEFLSHEMSMTLVGDSTSAEQIIQVYSKKVQANKPDHRITVVFEVKPEGEEFIIQSCQIKGHYPYVVEFFVKYWNTTLNFDDVKNEEVVTNYWISDRASLSADMKSNTASIEVIKN